MPAPMKCPQELRELAVRLVNEATASEEGLSLTAVVAGIGPHVGVFPYTWLRK